MNDDRASHSRVAAEPGTDVVHAVMELPPPRQVRVRELLR